MKGNYINPDFFDKRVSNGYFVYVPHGTTAMQDSPASELDIIKVATGNSRIYAGHVWSALCRPADLESFILNRDHRDHQDA